MAAGACHCVSCHISCHEFCHKSPGAGPVVASRGLLPRTHTTQRSSSHLAADLADQPDSDRQLRRMYYMQSSHKQHSQAAMPCCPAAHKQLTGLLFVLCAACCLCCVLHAANPAGCLMEAGRNPRLLLLVCVLLLCSRCAAPLHPQCSCRHQGCQHPGRCHMCTTLVVK